MLRLLTLLILISTAALTVPATAGAWTSTPDGLLSATYDDVDQWWSDQGSPPPCFQSSQVLFFTNSDHNTYTLGEAPLNSCVTWVNSDFLRAMRRVIARSPAKEKREAIIDLWVLVAHERGHDLGLKHSPDSIMDEHPGVVRHYAPARAYEFAASVFPTLKRHAAKSARRRHHH